MTAQKVLELGEGGNLAIDDEGTARVLTGVAAIRQNIVHQLLAQKRQGYLGVSFKDEMGLKWRRYNDVTDKEPAILDKGTHAEVIALYAAAEAARVPGVRAVTGVKAAYKAETREVDMSLKVEVGDDEFPTPVFIRFRKQVR